LTILHIDYLILNIANTCSTFFLIFVCFLTGLAASVAAGTVIDGAKKTVGLAVDGKVTPDIFISFSIFVSCLAIFCVLLRLLVPYRMFLGWLHFLLSNRH